MESVMTANEAVLMHQSHSERGNRRVVQGSYEGHGQIIPQWQEKDQKQWQENKSTPDRKHQDREQPPEFEYFLCFIISF